ncbi:hypothetical protein GCM10017586_25320 [Microbacterium imperiale]|uniref:Uncharacterized protein n=2 Tax=Microbacteriaceae TaxID=85023 RepID=A0A9W6M4E8_9MICO|nr:hypothetical protein GCM10017544_28530 [Microbacterium imperiale]GLJ80849.1 hypothetical protein GCM10017586_25320 [Microbacterium imperiale]
MMMSQSSGRRGVAWAIIGGLVLLAGIVAIIVSALIARPTPTPSEAIGGTASADPTPPVAPDPEPTGTVVDPTAADRGWTPEPITTDADTYIRAALAAASTFDTTKSTREEWLDYLDTWFTPDTRFTNEADQIAAMTDSQTELRQGVVFPQDEWDSLAGEDGRVVAVVTSDVTDVPVTDDESGDMSIGTADVTLSFTRSDGSGGETSYDDHVRVSVQVLCGAASVPTPDTDQRSGDCKVVRYFTEPLEP